MNRTLLFGVGAAVAAGLVLYLLVGRHHDDPSQSAPTSAADHPIRDVPSAPMASAGNKVTIRNTPGAPMTGADTPTIEYQREDGTVVRDHRGSDNAGTFLKPSLPYPTQSPVSAEVTATVMAQVRPIVLKCLHDVPDAAYGQAPLVMTRAKISIDAQGNLSVLELGTAASDIDASASAAAMDCIKQSASMVHTHVDHAAVESATLAFPIKPLDYRHAQ